MFIKKIPDTSGLVTTTVLNTKISEVNNKIRHTSSLRTTVVLSSKISESENKFPDHAKYFSTPEINELIAENFTAKSKQADLVSRTDFDNRLKSFNRKIISNKTRSRSQKEANSLIKKDFNFFLGRISFTRNDRSQNTFVYKPRLDKRRQRY